MCLLGYDKLTACPRASRKPAFGVVSVKFSKKVEVTQTVSGMGVRGKGGV